MDAEDAVYIYMYIHIHIHCVCVYIHFYIFIYTHNGILLSHKKDEILPFVTAWMDLEGIMLNEISQMEKDKLHMI